MAERDVVLEIHGISKKFPGVLALNDVELTLYRGEVLALIGENGAGKSTLMKVLLGEYPPTEGEMRLMGNPYHPNSPHDALDMGISMIHQEITLVPNMTVAENVWLGRESKFTSLGIISAEKRMKATKDLMEKLDIEVDVNAMVSELSVANMQLVEVLRAVSYDSEIIIMDEPTSALTDVEVDKLYAIIRSLTAAGKSVIFISHKLKELFTIADRVTVLRNGQYITSKPIHEVTEEELVRLMVGRSLANQYPKEDVPIGDVVLDVQNLTTPGVFESVSFQVRKGEILGFCGLIGAGRTEIMQSVFGIDRLASGSVVLNGKKLKIKKVSDAIRHGLAMVTEDRLRKGAIHKLSVRINMSLAYLNRICKYGFVDKKKELEDCNRLTSAMSIKVSGLNQEIGTLSGGNQQKVILGKWLLTQPEVLILDEPTRGIDVGAKYEIYKLIGELAGQGKAIILISSELQELMGLSDRILVVRNGKINGEFQRNEFDQENIMQKAFGL